MKTELILIQSNTSQLLVFTHGIRCRCQLAPKSLWSHKRSGKLQTSSQTAVFHRRPLKTRRVLKCQLFFFFLNKEGAAWGSCCECYLQLAFSSHISPSLAFSTSGIPAKLLVRVVFLKISPLMQNLLTEGLGRIVQSVISSTPTSLLLV